MRGKPYRVTLFDTVSGFFITAHAADSGAQAPAGRPGTLPHPVDELLPRRARRHPRLRHLEPRHLYRFGQVVRGGRAQHGARRGIVPRELSPSRRILYWLWAADTSRQVGAKLDKAEAGNRAVSTAEGQALAQSHLALFCEVSSKTKENVRRPFVEIVDHIVQTPGLLDSGTMWGRGTVAMESPPQGMLSGCEC